MDYDDILSNYVLSKRTKETKNAVIEIIKKLIDEINEYDRDNYICSVCYIYAIKNDIDNFVTKIIENNDDIFDDEAENDYIYKKYLERNLRLDCELIDFPYESCVCNM